MIKLNLSNKEIRRTDSFEAFDNTKLSAQGKKLLKEWKKIEDLCHDNDVINYIIRNRNREGLPVEYEIIFKIRSIVGVEEIEEGENKSIRKPIYKNEHRLSILLPNNYPSAMGGNPEFKMLSDTWHPNIRATGKFKGRICQNDKDLGIGVGLDERIIRVGKYLQFQMYWAHDSYPWPEDKTVAEWIREEAEPMGWVNVKEGIFTDNSRLRKKQEEVQPSEKAGIDATTITVKKDKEDVVKDKPKLIKLEKLVSKKPDSSESKDAPSLKKVIEIGKLKPDQQEKERLEKERLEAERIEKERLETERIEKERLEAERLEKERLEVERLEKERLEAERLEKERLEVEQLEKKRIEAERIEKERLEAERIEKERLEAERIEKERLEAERIEKERLEAERIEKERLEVEQLEKKRIETERIEKERLEAERIQNETKTKERKKAEFKERMESELRKKIIKESTGLRKKKKIIIR
jgi:hypothetical protein